MSTTVGDDEYFPSLLTGGATSPKKSKENSALGANAHDVGDLPWAVKRGPRLTFAESLSMEKTARAAASAAPTLGDVDTDDSPFNFARSATATVVRRRKPLHTQHHDDDDNDDDDAPPPPTSSLADPSGFLSDHLGGAKLDELPFRPAGVSSGLAASSASFFQGDEWGHDKQYWITVYGFPASSKSFILQHFQTLGDVIHYTSGAGNWLHVRYHTRLQAEKALSLDGQLLGGAIMVGVKRCLPSQLDGVRQEPTSSLYFSHARRNPGSKELEVDPIKEEDLMLPPRRRTDVCSRLLGFLFNW